MAAKTDNPVAEVPEAEAPVNTRTAVLQKITAIQGTIVHPITNQVFPFNQPVELEDVDSVLQAQIRAGLMSLG